MRLFRWEALFAGGVDSVILNFLPLFALAYGGSNAQIGLLGASVGLGAALACFPGAWLSARWRHRKPFVLLTRGVLGNLFLLVLAFGPLFGGPWALGLIIAAAGVRSFVMFLAESAWTSLATDMVPPTTRGKYFASRNLNLGLGGLAAAGVVAALLTFLGAEAGWAATWAAMFGLGVTSALFYSRIPEEELPVTPHLPEIERERQSILKDTRFLRYAGTVVLWSISVQAALPFFNVHLVKNLGASTGVVAALFVAGAVAGLLGQAYIGRLLDIKGSRWMMGLAGIAISFLPIAWYFINAPYQAGPINAAAGLLWAAYLLASFHLLLTISPPGQQRYYVATYHTLIFLTMFAGPLLGGAIAGLYGIKAIFLLSGVGRLIAVLAFITLVQDVEAEKQTLFDWKRTPGRATATAWTAAVQMGRRVRAGSGLPDR